MEEFPVNTRRLGALISSSLLIALAAAGCGESGSSYTSEPACPGMSVDSLMELTRLESVDVLGRRMEKGAILTCLGVKANGENPMNGAVTREGLNQSADEIVFEIAKTEPRARVSLDAAVDECAGWTSRGTDVRQDSVVCNVVGASGRPIVAGGVDCRSGVLWTIEVHLDDSEATNETRRLLKNWLDGKCV